MTDFRSRLLKAGKSAKTVSNILNLLNRLFADAREDQYVRVSPMPDRRKRSSDSQKPARDAGRGRALQAAQAQQLLSECDADLQLVVLLGLLAGLRRGEIFSLHFEDIDWDRDLIHARRTLFWRFGKYQKLDEGEARWTIGTPKKKSVRDVDLSPDLKDALWTRYMEMQMEGKAGLVFQSGKGGPLEPQNVYERRFRPACDRVREKAESVSNDPGRSHAERDEATATARMFERLRLHDLRHTFGSWLLDQGEDMIYVSRQMGHASPSITADVYSHVIREKRPEAAAKMSARLTGVG